MFGRATITLGIGPHSSFLSFSLRESTRPLVRGSATYTHREYRSGSSSSWRCSRIVAYIPQLHHVLLMNFTEWRT